MQFFYLRRALVTNVGSNASDFFWSSCCPWQLEIDCDMLYSFSTALLFSFFTLLLFSSRSWFPFIPPLFYFSSFISFLLSSNSHLPSLFSSLLHFLFFLKVLVLKIFYLDFFVVYKIYWNFVKLRCINNKTTYRQN